VTETFRQRGHDVDSVTWDSWRGEDGKWVVALRWQAGRSENRAQWTFHPGAHGGTVTAIDDHATDLIDPPPAVPLRTVPPVPEEQPKARAVPDDGPPYRPANPPPTRARKDRAIVPSWEDVLLGVRSPRT
ncbi:MAG TPA: septation protein SepH, partial [Pseudonocardiaceae bacterium]|nr:septation protein SepH [Pseudonocardiaceae bacterium]